MRIAILTTKNSTFDSYSLCLKSEIENLGYQCDIYHYHEAIPDAVDIIFILSYHRIIPPEELSRHPLNLVIHASDLPMGRGWSPITWQILDGRNVIVFTLFEATAEMDAGDIYLQKIGMLRGDELREEISVFQNELSIKMILEYLEKRESIKPRKQVGEATFYRKRTPEDSRLDIDKSIREQFNLLRVCDNVKYPAFFEINGCKYILKIEKVRA